MCTPLALFPEIRFVPDHVPRGSHELDPVAGVANRRVAGGIGADVVALDQVTRALDLHTGCVAGDHIPGD